MIYKNVSSEAIIIRLFRLFKEYSANMIGDTIEFIGEAIEDIGYYGQTEKKTVEVVISNYMGEIPCDLYKLNGEPVYNGIILPYGTGNFNYNGTIRADINYPNNTTYINPDDFVVDVNKSAVETAKDILTNLQSETNSLYPSFNNSNCYIIIPGYFKTSFESGSIFIDYEAFLVDEKGYPMIPDYIQFKDAVTYYCITKFVEIGYKHPTMSYEQLERKYYMHKSQASFQANLMDRPKFESFKNSWVRLIPNINPNLQLYETLRNQESPLNF